MESDNFDNIDNTITFFRTDLQSTTFNNNTDSNTTHLSTSSDTSSESALSESEQSPFRLTDSHADALLASINVSAEPSEFIQSQPTTHTSQSVQSQFFSSQGTAEDFVLNAVRQNFEEFIARLDTKQEIQRLQTFSFELSIQFQHRLRSWYLQHDQQQTIQPTEQMFINLIHRYKWSTNCPAGIYPIDLARCGFYYIGPDDNVKCFACEGKLSCWEENDCPKDEHSRHFGVNCDFTRGKSCGNIQILTNGTNDEAELHPFHPMIPNNERLTELQNIYPCQSPMYLGMDVQENRMASFSSEDWPHWRKPGFPSTKRLADAGFYTQSFILCFRIFFGIWRDNKLARGQN